MYTYKYKPVVTGGDRPETFLARRVPDLEVRMIILIFIIVQPHLKFDGLSVQLDCSDFKVDPDCGNVGFSVRVVSESGEGARCSTFTALLGEGAQLLLLLLLLVPT